MCIRDRSEGVLQIHNAFHTDTTLLGHRALRSSPANSQLVFASVVFPRFQFFVVLKFVLNNGHAMHIFVDISTIYVCILKQRNVSEILLYRSVLRLDLQTHQGLFASCHIAWFDVKVLNPRTHHRILNLI